MRPATATDPSHKILLLDASYVTPSHFPSEAIRRDGTTILWLSDLHVSDNHYHFPIQPNAGAQDLATALELDLRQLGNPLLATLLLSGDITWKASREEFGAARTVIERIQSWSRVRSSDIVACPGNHDLAFSTDPADKGAPVTITNSRAREGFASFYENLHQLSPNQFMSSGRRFLLGGTYPVEIAAVNSSYLEQTPTLFQGHGFVGNDQLADIEANMQWSKKMGADRPFRILMLHHHLIPVVYSENSYRRWRVQRRA